jgi:hypothetical protein
VSTLSYISAGLVHVGQLYEAVLAIGIIATIGGFVGMILSYIGAFGGFKSRKFLPVTILLTLISLVGAISAPAVVVAGQPGAFNSDNTSAFGGMGCGASPNPCTSFWNSVTTAGVTVSWGADVGWYFAVAAAVLLLVAFLLLWSTRKMPYTRTELGAAGTLPNMVQLSGGGTSAPISPPTSGAGGVATPPASTASLCPRCGNPMMYVTQYSRWYCLTERVYL